MKLWTAEIEEKAKQFPLGSQDGKGDNAEVFVKYFNPYGAGTWLITEAEQQEDGDWLLFGYCHITDGEWGYVMLSEIQNTTIDLFGFPMHLERDLYMGENPTVGKLRERNGI